ncbi:MAG: VpaChn25_0724 family phage protein [Planktomarina sp.]
MSYVETLAKHRRLTILKFLSDSPEYTSNGSILQHVCNEYGVTSTDDQILGELGWLEENGLVTFKTHGSVVVATATRRGVDVAMDRARHKGVQRPRADG